MLDKLEKRILLQLEKDSRQSNAQIAKKVRTSKSVVNYRIERMQKNKIIEGFTFISNQIPLGKLSFGLLLKFEDISLDQEVKLLEKFKRINQVAWVKAIDGKWNCIMTIIEKDVTSFNEVLQKIFEISEESIQKYEFYIDYEGSISTLDYIYDNERGQPVKYLSISSSYKLKELELKVYESLKKNPRASLLEIAHNLNTSYDTVKSKFISLKDKKILLRCSPKINLSKLGYENYLCLFNLKPSMKKTEELISFCVQHPNIIRYSKCLGHFNLILNIHSQNPAELKKITYELKTKFKNLINEYEIIPLLSQ